MAGLGLFPIGSTPFGSGTPDEAQPPPSGVPDLANFLDPSTGDYVVLDDGSYARMPLVRHRVLMCVKTVLGSAAHEPNVGLRLPKRMDQSFKQRARDAVLASLAIIGSDIRVDDVIVLTDANSTGKADITIVFTDLTTGNSDTLTI